MPTRLHTYAKLLAVAVIAMCFTTVTACGGNDTPAASHTATTTGTSPDTPPIPLLDAADINAGLRIELDPNTPAAQRTGLIQGADSDPDLVNRLAQAAKASGVQITVISVTYAGHGVMNATAKLTVNNQPVDGTTTVPFSAEGGRWKLQKAWACQMMANTNITSPACG